MNGTISRSLFDDFFKTVPGGYFVRPLHGDPLPSPELIRIDVQEAGPDYIVHADIPGCRKDAIQVHIEANRVTVSAEVRQEDRQVEDGKLIHAERYAGQVSRVFKLPQDIDQSAAKARYQDGVLVLTLPKASSRNRPLLVE